MSKLSRLALKRAFEKEQVNLGNKIEQEHLGIINKLKKNPKMDAQKGVSGITQKHLDENPKYYQKTPIVDNEFLLIPAHYKARHIVLAAHVREARFRTVMAKLIKEAVTPEQEQALRKVLHTTNPVLQAAIAHMNAAALPKNKVAAILQALTVGGKQLANTDFLAQLIPNQQVLAEFQQALKLANLTTAPQIAKIIADAGYDMTEAAASVASIAEKNRGMHEEAIRHENQKLTGAKPQQQAAPAPQGGV